MAELAEGGARAKTAIAGVDHAIIGVHDLEAARDRYRALGFTVTPRGRHIGWATANYCIMFPDDYLELLGILDPAGYSAGLDARLADQGEGLLRLAFRSDDAGRSHEFLAGQDLADEPPRDLARTLEAPEGTVQPAFRLVEPKPAALPGLAGFLCQHLSADLVWRPQWCAHANTAWGVRSYKILADDPSALAAGWIRLFGSGAVARSDGRLSVKTGTARLDFLSWDALVETYTDIDFARPRAGCILGVTLRVRDLVKTASCLAEAGAACLRTEDGLTVLPESACGVALAFVQEG